MKVLIYFNLVFQLKLVIYVTFHFGPPSFNFLIKLHGNYHYYSIIYLGPKVFICFNFILQLELIIYFIFYFFPYSFNFLFDINSFSFFNSYTLFIFYLCLCIYTFGLKASILWAKKRVSLGLKASGAGPRFFISFCLLPLFF